MLWEFPGQKSSGRAHAHSGGRADALMKTLRALIGLAIVVAFFYVAWKVVPPYMNDYEFEDAVAQIAHEATFNYQRTEQDVKEAVAKKAAEFDIPLKSEQVHVSKNGTEVIITGDYTIHIEMPVRPVDLHFHVNSKKT